jgi:autotransporter-associated beta strand protein
MKTPTRPSNFSRVAALAVAAAFCLQQAAYSQTASNLVVWGVNGLGGQSSAPTNLVATGIEATAITLGGGLSVNTLTNAISATNFNFTSAANALTGGDYLEFTVSPAANYSLSFSNLNNRLRSSSSGPTNAGWFWSRDAYATALRSTNAVNTNTAGAPLNATMATNGITTSTTFRVAGWNAGGLGGTFAIRANGATSENPVLVGTATLRAATNLVWDGGRGNGAWTSYLGTNADQANWNGNNTPLNGDTLVFAGAIQTNTTNNASSLLANAIVFTNGAGTFAISGNGLTVSNGITNLSANGQTFSNTVTLGAAQTFNASAGNLTFATNIANGGNTLTVSGGSNTAVLGVVSGGGGLVKSGVGTLTLSGANSYGGGTVVSAGRLVGSTTSLQGAITNDAAVTFNQTTNGTYFSGMSGLGSLTKSGTGTLTLSGVNAFSGATAVDTGRLIVNGTNANSAVTVASGASLGGSGTVGGVTVNGLLAPGNSVGTLNAGSTILNTNGSFELELFDFTGTQGTAWDLYAITGDLTLSNTVVNPFTINLVSMSSTTTPGSSINFNPNLNFTNTFLTYSGALSNGPFAANLFTVNTNSFANTVNGSFSVTNVTGGLALLYTTLFVPAAQYVWNAGAGLWSVAANWTNNATPTANSALVFTGPAGTATNDATVTSVAGLTFSNTIGSIVLAGDALAVGAEGIVNVSDNGHTISNNLSFAAGVTVAANTANLTFAGNLTNAGAGLTFAGASNNTVSGVISGAGNVVKTGAGSLALDGNNTFTGTLSNSAGTTVLNGTQDTTTVNVTGGTLLLGADDRLANGATVTVSGGSFNTDIYADTIGTLVLSGSGQVAGSGVLTATTYTLNGGTVAGALGAGTANVGGSVALNGTMDSTTLNVNIGGTLTLGSSDRIGNTTAVVANGGILNLGANSDEVGSLVLTNSGSLTGSGTLTAATYTLNGGTVGANLGTGTATSSAGTTALNGTLAGDLAVAGGTVNLGSSDRIGNSSAVSISSGTLGMGANNDNVGSFAITSGILGGSGTLTASTYALNGGTVTANLGVGAATSTSGATALNGTFGGAGSSLTVDGGTVTLGNSNRINDSVAVVLGDGTLSFGGFTDTVSTFAITGGNFTNGALTATTYALNGGTVAGNLGAGAATASSNSTALNGTLGASLTVDGGTVTLGNNDRITNTSAVVLSNGTLNFGGFTDTVSTFAIAGGSFTNGTLTAGSYALNGGTVAGNLGAGAATASSNSTALNGTLGANLTVGGGTVTLGSADRITNTATVAVNSGSLNFGGFTDGVSSFTITGGNFTNGTLTATTYALQGGTVAGNLGIGTATAASGTTALNGTLDATTVNVSGGTVNLGSADRLANAAAVTISSGALNLNGNDTVGTFAISSGSLGGSGTLTASTYGLGGGTVGANLGTGTINATASTALNGTANATAVNVTGGTLTLGSAGRLTGTTPTIMISNGAGLALGGNESIGTLNLTNGTVSGSGTLTVSSAINAQQGTVSANLSGAAGLTKSGPGTVTLSGSNNYAGGTLVSGGRLVGSTTSLQGAITNNTAVTFDQAGNGTYAGAMTGSGSLAKSGTGSVTLSASNSYAGGTTVGGGALVAANNNSLGTGAVVITNGAVTAADGVTVGNSFTIGTPGGTTLFYSQNFNDLGTNTTATLPDGWKFSAAGQGATNTFWTNTGNLTATTQQASSGSPVTGGRYNWGFSNDTANRSIGFMTSGSYDPPNSIMFAFTNTTGQAMTNLTVSFDYLRFRTNTTAISNVFFLSDSSTAWGSAISTNNWSTGTSGYNFAPTAVSLTNTISMNIASGGVGYMMWRFVPTTDGNSQGIGLDNLVMSNAATATGSGTLGIAEAGTVTFTGNVTNNNNATLTAASGGTAIFSNVISGAGTVTKTGAGTVTFSGSSANTYTNTTTVSAGTLQLNKTAGTTAVAGNLVVTNGATLLISASDQVANTSAVTLSGTIVRGDSVNERMGTLNLTGASTIDFGSGAPGTLRFGTYEGGLTPDFKLTINGFSLGNTLIFGNDITSWFPTTSFTGTSFTGNSWLEINGMEASAFGGFRAGWGGGVFTITSVPEPSTYVAAAGLLALLAWPMRRRLVRDARSILGLRAPMRDRLARKA